MVRDGYFYALGFIAATVLVGWFAQPAWAVVPLMLALFFLWFFRDPERVIPDAAGAVVSPGDVRPQRSRTSRTLFEWKAMARLSFSSKLPDCWREG